MKKRLYVIVLIVIIAVALICLAARSGSRNGTYYCYDEFGDMNPIGIEINGNKWKFTTGDSSGELEYDGDNVTFYIAVAGMKIEYMHGTLSNDILKINMAGTEIVYYKDGVIPGNEPTIGNGNSDSNKQQFIVTFNTLGGSYVEEMIVIGNSTFAAPSNPTKGGYVFDGWYTNDMFTAKWNFQTDVVTKDMTLYAGWLANLKYQLNEQQTAYVVNGLADDVISTENLNIIIPQIYNGKPVIAIADNAFGEMDIVSVTIPDSVIEIGVGAFAHCTKLVSVSLGNGVQDIGDNAFFNCPMLEKITLPANVSSIGNYAFYNCSQLKEITIPSSVSNIGSSAFGSCYYLNKVNITDITSWCNISFADSSSNPLQASLSTHLYMNGQVVEDIVIPDTVTEIKPYAFCNYQFVKTLVISDNTTTIGAYAFNYCRSLTSIAFGDGVQSIGKCAFFRCYSLSKITFGSNLRSIGEHSFYECNVTSIVIPEGVENIDNEAFGSCDLLTRVSLPNSIQNLSYSAFSSCRHLQYTTYGKEIYLGNDANPYVILVAVTSQDITECTIPIGTRIIMEYAFYNCNSLSDVYYKGSAEAWGKINIGEYNTELTNANIHYFGEFGSEDSGNLGGEDTGKPDNKDLCSTCNGNGIVSVEGTCSVCSGSGTVSSTRVCSTCSGRGWSSAYARCSCGNLSGTVTPNTSVKLCLLCGTVMSVVSINSCSSCSGTGRLQSRISCSYCSGTGHVMVNKACEDCDGSGYIATSNLNNASSQVFMLENDIRQSQEIQITVDWCRRKGLDVDTADIRVFGRRFKQEYAANNCELVELGTKANYYYVKLT